MDIELGHLPPTSVVWKYELEPKPGNWPVAMPTGATVLAVKEQFGKLIIWAACDPQQPMAVHHFLLVMTGSPFDPNGLAYVGTAMLNNGSYILHVFERMEQAK